MLGAVGSHLLILGIEVDNDGGLLFALAVICLIGGAWLAFPLKTMPWLAVLFLFAACETQDATPTVPVNDEFDPSKAVLLKQGTWKGAGSYNVSGTAMLYQQTDGKLILLIDSFSSSNGPDLKVYLSTDAKASSFISMGALKSVAGRQLYELPTGTKAENYSFALIWCERFSVLFGEAALK
jgi:hypothetical protein